MVEIGLHLPLATFSDGIPCRGHSARKSTLFGHRCTLFWPPPVRLFAQPTHAREASRQHPAGDVDAYAHTHAHADQLWGPQYENAKPAVPFLAYAQDTFGIPSYSGVCTFTQKTASSTPNLETALQYITKYSIARILQQYVSYVRV